MLAIILHAVTSGTREGFQMLAALVLALGVIAFGFIRVKPALAASVFLRLKRGGAVWGTLRRLSFLLEPMVLLGCIALTLAYPMFLPPPFGCAGQKLFATQNSPGVVPQTMMPEFLLPASMSAFPMLAALVLCLYLFRNRSLFLFMGVFLPGLMLYLLLRWKSFPVLDEIHAMNSQLTTLLGPSPRFLVSIFLPGVRYYAAGAAAVLGGLYCSRRQFSPWKYLLGAFAGALGVGYLTQPFLSAGTHNLLLQALLFAVTARLMVQFPVARKRLESLSGLRLSTEAVEFLSRPATPLQWILGHGALLALVFVTGASGFENWFERETMRMIYFEWRPTYRSPAMQNAYQDVERLFLKASSPIIGQGTFEKPYQRLSEVHAAGPDIRDDAYWSSVDKKQLLADFAQFEPFTKAFRAAAEKDYFEEPAPVRRSLSFLNVRECSRILHTHALLCMRDGNTTEALGDIRAVLGFGGLLKDHPFLVGQMIGVAVRGLATDAAYQYYVYYRHDPEKIRALARLLEELAPKARCSLNVEALRRGEPAFLPVAVCIEFMFPAMLRAENNANMQWLNYEALRVATNLELYKADFGKYPEKLDQLAPAYLPLLPRDPFKGLPLTYRPQTDDFVLDSPSKAGKPFTPLLAFPPLSLEEVKKANKTR